MKFKITISLVLLTLFCSVFVFSQNNNCADLQALIDKTYNFKPSKLNADEQTATSAEIDIIWNKSFEALRKFNKNGLSENYKIAINQFLTDPNIIEPREGEPKGTREQFLEAFQELVEGKSEKFIKLTIEVTDGEKDAVAVMKEEDIPLIRKARRYFAASATPHSPEWYQSFTDILMAMVKKYNAENKDKIVK